MGQFPPPRCSEALWSYDRKSIYHRLSEQTPYIFSKETDETEIWLLPDGNEFGLEKWRITHHDLVQPVSKAGDAFYVIPQAHSRDRLRITKDTFASLISLYDVFPYFLETVQAFGVRIQDDENTWNNFHYRSHNTDEEGHVTELCYTIRFFEQNHRTTGDPWSLRQTGIYHRFHTASGTSTWILIKPSPDLKARLEEKLKALSNYGQFRKARHLLHLMIISFTLQNWRSYIATQQSQMREFESKSFFSNVDHDDPNDYRLNFEDRQNLQRLLRKLMKAGAVLDSGTSLGNRLKACLEKISVQLADEVKETIAVEVEDFLSETEYHKRCIIDLQQRCSDTATLLLDILERRFGKATLRSAVANEQSQAANVSALQKLADIAMNGELEHDLEQRTAINMRALTVVATLYLPASLLAAIFSSNLVEVKSDTFVVSPESWKFFVVMIPMIGVTMAIVVTLQLLWTKKHRAELEGKRRRAQNISGP